MKQRKVTSAMAKTLLLAAILSLSTGCWRSNTPAYSTWAAKDYDDDGVFLLYSTPRQIEDFKKPNSAELVDRNGRVIHKWDLHCPPMHAEVYPGMKLAVACYTLPIKNPPGTYGKFKFLDRDSKFLWSFEDDAIHHDFERLDDGHFFLIRNRKLEKKDFEKANQKFKAEAIADQIILVDKDQNVTWTWDLFADLDRKTLRDLDFADRQDLTHGNTVRYYASNPLTKRPCVLLSFRNISQMFLVDFETKKLIWKSPKGSAAFQHDPSFIDNNSLVYLDNGPHGADWRTRVKEINLFSNQVETIFQHILFAIPIMGSVQKLKNGNYLIGDSIQGHGFEIDPQGRKVFSISNKYISAASSRTWLERSPFFKLKKFNLKDLNQ